MRRFRLLIFIFVIILAGCRLYNYPCKLVESNQQNVEGESRFYCEDLNGDSEDEIVLINNNKSWNQITIRNKEFDVYSQMNYSGAINYVSFLDVDGDAEQELFISFVDNDSIYLERVNYEWKKQLSRDGRMLYRVKQSRELPSTLRCYGYFGVNGFADNRNIYLSGGASFSCFPRGLWVIDSVTAEEKWRYETAGNCRNVYHEDIDGDGLKEYIFTTQATKNHKEVINGTDDFHSYLIILNSAGSLLYQEEIARGFSMGNCFLEDTDGDGLSEIVLFKTTWGNQHERNGIFIYKWEDNKLTSIKERQFEKPLSRKGVMQLCDLNNDGRKEFIALASNGELSAYDHNLELIRSFSKWPLKRVYNAIDLDCDGRQELVCVTANGHLVVLNQRFQVVAYNEKQLKNERIGFYNPGYGKRKEILVNIDGIYTFFKYQKTGILEMICWDIIGNIFAIMLFAVLLISIYITKRKLKIREDALSSLSIAVVVLTGRNEVCYASRQIQAAMDDKEFWEKLDFRELLLEEIRQFRLSNASSIKLKKPVRFKSKELEIHLEKASKSRIVIEFIDKTDFVQLQEKANWAETARGLSHGIRKHLNNISLASEQISEIEDIRVSQLSEIVMDEIEHLKYFIQSFQRFTELKALTLQRVNGNEFIYYYLEELMPELPAEIRFLSEVEPDLPEINIDQVRFVELLNNMMNNAVEAIEETGKIIMRVYRWEKNRFEQRLCIEISDTGCGMSKEVLENIYVPYFTTKSGGTGIGLPLARKMMKEFDGEIEVESKERVGTTVRLVIPAAGKGK